MSLKGRSDLLGGEITYVELHYGYLGLDGNPQMVTGLGGVFTGPSGDALFIEWIGVPRLDGVVGGYGRFAVRGGRGRFVGATGGGTLLSVLKQMGSDYEVTQIYEGAVLLPKR
jgi:hypothetical protein